MKALQRNKKIYFFKNGKTEKLGKMKNNFQRKKRSTVRIFL